MNHPLVSIVCLCHNQARFVSEALHSVFSQTYPNIQLIVVDDASTDNSVAVISEFKSAHPEMEVIFLTNNAGNCKAFNKALALVRGDYVIDFAADDILMPDRVQKQVDFFSNLDAAYGVVFTDATYVNENGRVVKNHYEDLARKKLVKTIPQGDVYRFIIDRYFISSPTMMVRRQVFHELKGYDEALSYEDFDFWVRSSRIFKYGFLNERLTQVRMSPGSMSSGWYRPGDKQLHSTYLVCRKIAELNRTPEEHRALVRRLRYELRQSVFSENVHEAKLFHHFLVELKEAEFADHFLKILNAFRLPLLPLRKWYHKFRYNL